ncbi:hypothetical protein CMV_008154 [Castanea mollissima]|uniref:RNA polymerase II transcription factor B subunit 2 n=1 Tax=Castanea mollissima TaxID=60419 RepID=A0A8J4VZS1_9ROSI|nr:hypothetical protein CMV_008154 [Castanea mollissima]
MDTNSKELERLVKQKEELSAIIEKQETRLNNLQSSAFGLANYYFVFQGVILTIICNGAKNLKPSDRWFLFTISILAVLVNLIALIKTGIKYIETIGSRDIFIYRRNNLYGEIVKLDGSYYYKNDSEKPIGYKERQRLTLVSFKKLVIVFLRIFRGRREVYAVSIVGPFPTAVTNLLDLTRLLYFAKLWLGSPPKDYYVQVDTGSDILWVNCVDCKRCPKKSGLGVCDSINYIFQFSKMDKEAPRLTESGFQFLLMDTNAQLWYIIREYISNSEERGVDPADLISFLLELSFHVTGECRPQIVNVFWFLPAVVIIWCLRTILMSTNLAADEDILVSCNGIGCCKTTISSDLDVFTTRMLSMISSFKRTEYCNYASLVDQKWFEENLTNHFEVRKMSQVPVVLNWEINESSYSLVMKSNSSSSTCQFANGSSLLGNVSSTFKCTCDFGFEGNPYLVDGCQDIDECEDPKSCSFSYLQYPRGYLCVNLPGTYFCMPDLVSDRKSRKKIIIIGIGLLFLFIGGWWSYKVIKKRKNIKRKEKFFKRNGGLLLQQQLSSSEVTVEKTTKLFSSKDLEKATDNFNVNRILGQGGQGTVYKGMLTDGKIVAVKKSKVIDE